MNTTTTPTKVTPGDRIVTPDGIFTVTGIRTGLAHTSYVVAERIRNVGPFHNTRDTVTVFDGHRPAPTPRIVEAAEALPSGIIRRYASAAGVELDPSATKAEILNTLGTDYADLVELTMTLEAHTPTAGDLDELGDELDPDLADLAEQQAIADVGRLTISSPPGPYWDAVARHYFRIAAKRARQARQLGEVTR